MNKKNKNVIKTFSLADLDIIRREGGDDDVDFAYGRVGFLSTGFNGQHCWIEENTLRRDAHTVLGKFITAKYNIWNDDVMSHEKDSVIVGYVPKDAEITFEETDDGRIMAYTECLISKIYATNVYEMFLHNDNYRAVSVEFSCALASDSIDGEGEIIGFQIHSITILGKKITPAIKDANLQIKKFSVNEAEDVFERLKLKMLSERKENSMAKITNLVKDEKKFAEDSEKDKDVIMSEEDESTKEKVEDKKTSESDEDEKENEKELSEDKQCSEEVKEEEKMSECDGEKEFSEDSKEEPIEENKEKESDEDEEKSDDDAEEEKAFSLDAYADMGAYATMLENETEENKALCDRLMASNDIILLFSTILAEKKKNDEYEAKEKAFEAEQCSKKFSEIMMSVKSDIANDTYASLYEEGKELSSMNEVLSFEAKVKALAYDESKKKRTDDDEVFTMSAPISNKNNNNTDDVFARLESQYK